MPMPYTPSGQAAPTPTAEPPREAMEQAWADLRAHGNPNVAACLDETLAADGTGASLVRLHARLIAKGLPRFRELPDPTQQVVRQAPRWHATPAPHRTSSGGIDVKRRASGERDDD